MNNFADRLTAEVQKKKTPICLGLDPHWNLIPETLKKGNSPSQVIENFLNKILVACADYVACVKPNIAFFEEWGAEGIRVLENVCQKAKELDLPVIVDAKRGDIGSTAEAYARTFLTKDIYDALTINPYLGTDSITPFVKYAQENGKGLFVLVKTSNPSSADFQDLICDDNTLLAEHVAQAVARWGVDLVGESGFSSMGAVVGATHKEDIKHLRAEMPAQIFLIPGYGAQGAVASDIFDAFYEGGKGAIVNSSRGILFAGGDDDFEEKALEKAVEAKNEFQALWSK